LPALTRETFTVRSRSKDEDDARALALTLTMEGRTASLRCPTLVVAGKKDRLIPWKQAERLHREVDASEFLLLEEGNHGCANVVSAHRYRTADWMAARLRA
jgi:pimeloyl-ACP methyl ester carboxylesterase